MEDATGGTGGAKTQRARILALLIRAGAGEVPLSAILDLRISQYSARILELRRLGFKIDNRKQRQDDGTVHSWFKLIAGPEVIPPAAPTKASPLPATPERLETSKQWIQRARAEPEDEPGQGTLFDVGKADRSYRE
jgi:hypothetical protein